MAEDWNIRRLEINRLIRAIMVRHGIDLGKVTTHVYPRRIMVRGKLVRISGAGHGLDAMAIQAMFHELGRIQGVRVVQHELNNWTQRGDDLGWVPTAGG